MFLNKFYFVYAIIVVLIFSPISVLHLVPPLPQAIPMSLFMSMNMGHVYKFFGFSISYTVLYIPMAIL